MNPLLKPSCRLTGFTEQKWLQNFSRKSEGKGPLWKPDTDGNIKKDLK
jgi:hypothetical protein